MQQQKADVSAGEKTADMGICWWIDIDVLQIPV